MPPLIAIALAFLWVQLAAAQGTAVVLAPALDAAGGTPIFGAAIPPGSAVRGMMDIYAATADGKSARRLTQLPATSSFPIGATAVAASPDGSRAAFTAIVGSGGRNSEEVHVVDTVAGKDRTVAVDTEGCIQPLIVCPNCFFPCLHTPHFSPDGTKVLYTSSRNQPFFVVNSDGSGANRLPVYSGSLAPAPQRVISRTGLVVFTSSATSASGTPAVALPTNVYVMNLDGSNVRAVTRFADERNFAQNAVISADGSVVVFLSSTAGNSQPAPSNLFLARTDGSSLRQLTFESQSVASFSLSADGLRVAYVRGGQIYLLYTDGRPPVEITSLRQSSVSEVVIVDDGSRIFFTMGLQFSGQAAIASVAADGSDFRFIYAPRSINPNGIVGLAAAPSPGSFFSLYGTNFAADGLLSASGLPLPQQLGGVSVTVNGQRVPVQAVTPWQVNAQLPQDVSAGMATFQLQFSDGTSLSGAAAIEPTAPAAFWFAVSAGPNVSFLQTSAFHAGTATPADMTHPASAGETLEFYGTGLGATNPPVDAGAASPANPAATAIAAPLVTIGGKTAQITFAGLTPGFAGLYQIDAIVPAGLKSGLQPVGWMSSDHRAGTISSAIWIQ